MDYKKAGVDIEAGYKSVELMKQHVPGWAVFRARFRWMGLREWRSRHWCPGRMAWAQS